MIRWTLCLILSACLPLPAGQCQGNNCLIDPVSDQSLSVTRSCRMRCRTAQLVLEAHLLLVCNGMRRASDMYVKNLALLDALTNLQKLNICGARWRHLAPPSATDVKLLQVCERIQQGQVFIKKHYHSHACKAFCRLVSTARPTTSVRLISSSTSTSRIRWNALNVSMRAHSPYCHIHEGLTCCLCTHTQLVAGVQLSHHTILAAEGFFREIEIQVP